MPPILRRVITRSPRRAASGAFPVQAAPISPGRIPELDGLRCLAILAVIAEHYVLGRFATWTGSGIGWVGVDLFFVISGFLITGILQNLRSAPHPFRTFYARRTLRIFPPYYAVLLLYLLAVLASPASRHGSMLFWAVHAFYFQSDLVFGPWLRKPAGPFFVLAGMGVLWSLSVEEQFYLLWAPLMLRCRRSVIWLLLALAMVSAPVIRACLHTPSAPEYFFFPARWDTLALGAVAALLYRQWLDGGRLTAMARYAARLAWAGLVVLTASLIVPMLLLWPNSLIGAGLPGNRIFAVFGYTAIGASFALFLLATVLASGGSAPILRVLRSRAVVWIGRRSYVIYLVHLALYKISEALLYPPLGHGRPVILAAQMLGLGLSGLVAAASWKYFESPLLALKDRFGRTSILPLQTAAAGLAPPSIDETCSRLPAAVQPSSEPALEWIEKP